MHSFNKHNLPETVQVNSDKNSSKSRSLKDWLCYIEGLHSANIALGLDRVGEVAIKLNLNKFNCAVVTVAGTNGKGTTCALIENILLEAGFQVGVYSSPHLLDYRERVRINGDLLSEAEFCQAFSEIENSRGGTALTYFEFGTLAALQLFKKQKLDLIILEVGLGGRLDATNIVDSDIAVITSIDLDHCDWLGDTRELIGFEKAGIFRQGLPVVCGDPEPPQSVLDHAKKMANQLYLAGKDFQISSSSWFGSSKDKIHHVNLDRRIDDLPASDIPQMNIASALAVIELLPFQFDDSVIRVGILNTKLPGRMQCMQTSPLVIADVAHNPQATGFLAQKLSLWQTKNPNQKVFAVAAMLKDKDFYTSMLPLSSLVSEWFLCSLDCPRGSSAEVLQKAVCCHTQNRNKIHCFSSVEQGIKAALVEANENDLIIAFGSFYTVEAVLNFYSQYNKDAKKIT